MTSDHRVLVVDDEPGIRDILTVALRREGFEIVAAAGCAEAVEKISQHPRPFPLVLTDLLMPDGSGMDVLRVAKERCEHTEVVVLTAHSTVEAALDAMRGGAYDFVTKPFSPRELVALAHKALEKSEIVAENRRLRAQLSRFASDHPLGDSQAMRKVQDLVEKVAKARTTVLLTGESGTGKERVARLLHRLSDRADKPFLVVNCGALPEALMESELFGHEKGSFTGADARALGLFRSADGGTVLLDEIGELPLSLQVKLLRVLQERKVRPVGGAVEVDVDVRVIAATNRDVEADVKSGKFREDLYYRLNVIRIEIPPLRERPGDVLRLADQFVTQYAKEHGKELFGLTADAQRALDRYDFPGNVRELENIIERAVTLASGRAVGLGDLPEGLGGMSAYPRLSEAQLPEQGCVLDDVLGEIERRLILEALERTGGVRKAAAELLGVTFRSFRYRMAKHGLAKDTDDNGRDSSPSAEPE